MFHTLRIIFWLLLFTIFYIYAGYPIIIYFLSRIFTKTDNQHNKLITTDKAFFPLVSFLIPAYNEESVIRNKIENTLKLDYPQDKIEIAVASDGSTDATNKIIKSYQKRIKTFIYNERTGKTNLINETTPKLSGEIIVFSDASAILENDSLKKLIVHFQDMKIGCVSGKYKLKGQDFSTRSRGESFYWKYEAFIKKQESRFYSILGAHGALYAIRKKLFRKLPPDAINDDYILPMLIIKQGYRAIYENKAIATEIAETSTKGEIKRRKRISAGNFQQLFILKSLLNPTRGKIAFEFFSHKLLRSFAFIFMIAFFIINVFLNSPFYRIFFILQIFFYLSGIIGYLIRLKGNKFKFLTIPFYIFLINSASLLGFIEFLKGNKQNKWEKSTM